MDGSGGSAPRRYRVAIYCDRLGRGEKRYQVGNFVGRDHSLCEIGSGQPTFDLVRGDALRPGLPFDELVGLFGARTTRVYADHRDSGRRKSSARFFVSAATPTLRIEPMVEPVWSAARPEMLIMRPPPCAAMWGATSRMVRR